mmetsp:Transcript_72431/g.125569  ORF Transcript_72431/g.125569 Transcript_72431/m.125569 type:complete len:151 (-) Transcript_72431:62-514(-)
MALRSIALLLLLAPRAMQAGALEKTSQTAACLLQQRTERHSGGLEETVDLLEGSENDVNGPSYKAFLEEAAKSAHQKSSLTRQASVEQQVMEEMEMSVPMQSHFDTLIEEDEASPGLSAMAARNRALGGPKETSTKSKAALHKKKSAPHA